MFDVWFMQLWVCLISTSCLCSSVARSVPLRAVQILRPGAERETPPHAALPWMVCPGQLCMFYFISFYLSEILPLHVCAWKLLLLFLIFRVKGRGSRASRYQEALPGRVFFNIRHWQSSHIHKYRTWWYLKDFGINVSEYMPKIQKM